MRGYSATDLANRTGDVLSAAAQEAVEITRHGKPRFVLMSHERFERLVRAGDSRRAMQVEDMSPEERAAVIAALEDDLDDG